MPKPTTLKYLSKTDHCKIYETDQFQDGLYFVEKRHHAGKKVLVPLDLDNTVLSYRHTLGTDQWFDFDFKQFLDQGMSAYDAKWQTLPYYLNIVKNIHEDDIYAVENHTPEHIRKMQALGVDVIALTSRGKYLLDDTKEQLGRFEIDFNKAHYADKEVNLTHYDPEAIFQNGMILCAGQHKGKCLFDCIDKNNMPEVIVMWDDKLSNLEKVADTVKQYNAKRQADNSDVKPIEFIGIRYSKLDHLIQHVDPNIIDLQRKYFSRILSDDHAKAILKHEQKKLRQHCVGIEYDQAANRFLVSVSKYYQYEVLKSLLPDIDEKRELGGVKTIFGKPKLTWQYQFDIAQFRDIFEALGRHGMVESHQFHEISAILAKPNTNTFTPGFTASRYALRPHRAEHYDKNGKAHYKLHI